MNHRYLILDGIKTFLNETELDFSDIMRAIIRDNSTGINIGEGDKLKALTDQDWAIIIDKAFEYEQE